MKPRFVLNIGSIAEEYPDMAGINNIGLWDRQECRFAAIFPYPSAICLETEDSAPFTALEAWFNSLSNEDLESEGIPPTRSEPEPGWYVARRHYHTAVEVVQVAGGYVWTAGNDAGLPAEDFVFIRKITL